MNLLGVNQLALNAQSCEIDFEEIITELEAIDDVCSCDQYIELGEVGQTKNISDYTYAALSGINVENLCIKVFGTLIIDETKHFYNCDFIMDAGAEIVVDVIFGRFINSTFQSCGNYLWNGISIGENGYFLHFNGNVIKHSHAGINTYFGSTNGRTSYMFMQENKFIDNYLAVNIGERNNFNHRTRLFLQGNTFYNNPPLKDHWSSGPVLDNTTGVQVLNAILDADGSADPCNDRNVFMQLHQGISLNRCESRISYSFFYNFIDIGSALGTGIISSGSPQGVRSNLVVNGGYSYFQQSGIGVNFEDVSQPIRSFNTETRITSNKIKGAKRGFEVFRPTVNNTIFGNVIQASEFGIKVTDNLAPAMRISYNDIEINSNSTAFSRGIEVSSIGMSARNGELNCNLIDLNPGRVGILLNNVSGKNATTNTITINGEPGGSASGIELRGGEFNVLNFNDIEGSTTTPYAYDVNGIKLATSTMAYLKANSTDNLDVGFHFSGSGFWARQEQNEFNDHHVGLFLDQHANIGDQYFNGNLWQGNYDHLGALLEDPSNNNGNRHVVYTNLQNTDFYPPSLSPDNETWFFLRESGTHDPIPDQACLSIWPDNNQEFNHTDSLIAKNNFSPTHFTERRKWEARRYLYKRIMDSDGVIGNGYPFNDFMDSMANTDIADYYAINKLLSEVSEFPDNLLNQINDQDSAYQNLKSSADYWMNNWINETDSIHYLETVFAYNEMMDSVWSISNALYEDWVEGIADELSVLKNQLFNLNPTNVYATNEKLVLESIITYLEDPNAVSESMKDDLRFLAESCALENGTSVFRAGAVLNLFHEDRITEIIACEDNSQNRIIRSELLDQPDWVVHPNPTTGHITIDFGHDKLLSGTLSLINMEGKLLMDKEINDHQGPISIDIVDQTAGVYIIRWEDGEAVRNTRIILNK